MTGSGRQCCAGWGNADPYAPELAGLRKGAVWTSSAAAGQIENGGHVAPHPTTNSLSAIRRSSARASAAFGSAVTLE